MRNTSHPKVRICSLRSLTIAARHPQLNQMLYSSQAGWSEFHGLNLKLEKRFSSGFQILMAHTFAKSIDTDSAGSFGSPNLNPANFQLDKGLSDFDIRNRWVTSVVYELPFGRGKRLLGNANRAADLIVGGWQFEYHHTHGRAEFTEVLRRRI